MLDLIGWSRCTSDTWVLRDYVTWSSDDGSYAVALGGPWVPEPGDVVTDSLDVSDNVVSTTTNSFSRLFKTPNGGTPTLTDGWMTITRKRSVVPPSTANFRGIAYAVDNTVDRRIDLTVDAGNVIVDTTDLDGNVQKYAPEGWAYADVVVIEPTDGSVPQIRSAHWHSPQGVKLLINGHATRAFAINDDDASIDENKILTPGSLQMIVGPGDTVALIRDTQGSNDHWRARANNVAPLFRYATGTSGSSSERYIWDADGKALYGPYGNTVPAIAQIGGKNFYQSEGTRTNRINAVSAWTETGAATITGSQPDPSGGTGAYLLSDLGNTGVDDVRSSQPAGGTPGKEVGVGIFVKKSDSSNVWDMRAINTGNEGLWTPDNAILSSGWERLTADNPGLAEINPFKNTAGGGSLGFLLSNPGGAMDIDVWLPQLSDDSFLSSPIAEGATRNADVLALGAQQVPVLFRELSWEIDVTVEHADTDLATSDLHLIYWMSGSAYLAIEEDGGGNVQAKLVTTGGSIARTITYSRNQTMTFKVDFVSEELTVTGATAGDGTSTATIADWASGTLFVGSDSTPANHFFGRISEPVLAL